MSCPGCYTECRQLGRGSGAHTSSRRLGCRLSESQTSFGIQINRYKRVSICESCGRESGTRSESRRGFGGVAAFKCYPCCLLLHVPGCTPAQSLHCRKIRVHTVLIHMLEKHPISRGLPWGSNWTCQARACGWPIRASIIIITSSSGQLPRLECYSTYEVQLPRQTCRGSLTAFQRSPAQPGGKCCAFCFLSCARVNFFSLTARHLLLPDHFCPSVRPVVVSC